MRLKTRIVFVLISSSVLLAGGPLLAQNFLSVTNACAMEGNYGLQVNFVGSNSRAYVLDDSPAGEGTYRASFQFNPNSINMPNGDNHSFFTAWVPNVWAGKGFLPAFQLYIYSRSGRYDFRGIISYDNDTKRLATGFLPIAPLGSNVTRTITVEFQVASSASVGDGFLSIEISNLPGVTKTAPARNHAMLVDFVRLGPLQGIDPTTTGSYCFDDFQSFRTLAP